MKKYLFGMLAIALAIGFSAFTVKKSGNKVLATDYFYKSGVSNQRIEPGFLTTLPTTERSITTTFKDAARWTATPVSYSPYSSGDGSSYMGKLSFNDEPTSDGDNDGSVSLQEAINAVFNKYAALSNTMPASVFVDNDNDGIGVTVSIELAEAVH